MAWEGNMINMDNCCEIFRPPPPGGQKFSKFL